MVDVEGGESTITNGRDAVWNGHAAEAFLKKAASPMVVTLFGMVTLVRELQGESIITNGRDAVTDGHAGEACWR